MTYNLIFIATTSILFLCTSIYGQGAYQELQSQHKKEFVMADQQMKTIHVGEPVFQDRDLHLYEAIHLKTPFSSSFKLLGPNIELKPGFLLKKYQKGNVAYFASQNFTVKKSRDFKHVGLKFNTLTKTLSFYLLDGRNETVYPLPENCQWSFVEVYDQNYAGHEESLTYQGIKEGKLAFLYHKVELTAKEEKKGLFFNSTTNQNTKRRDEWILIPLTQKTLTVSGRSFEIVKASESSLLIK